jgi:hypothetical protein
VTPSLFSGYVLDADFIIGLGRRINPLEMRVKAREIVDELSAQARIKSPMEVYFELSNKSKNSGDEVLAWCNSHREIFEDLTESVLSFASPKGPPRCQKHGTTSGPSHPAMLII